MLRRITIDDVLSWNPCDAKPGEKYSREGLELIAKRRFGDEESVSPLVIASRESVPVEDRLWLFLRHEIIPYVPLRLLACDFAEYSLSFYEQTHSEYDTARSFIEAKRRHLRGGITDEELDDASGAVSLTGAMYAAYWGDKSNWEAAWYTAWHAARDAGAHAARNAADLNARRKDTAWYVGRYAERRWQLDRTVDVLEKLEAAGG